MSDEPSLPTLIPAELVDDLMRAMGRLFKAHPWHGVTIGDRAPEEVNAFIEIVPTDTIKFELDKASGHIKVDRPQLFSNVYPTLYGFIPQTYCADKVCKFAASRAGRPAIRGDGDPMDICVLSERDVAHGEILLRAIPVGGLRMIDGNEADDKIVAVMPNDASYGECRDISELPVRLVERLRHYFLTYKDVPGASPRRVEVTHVYGREEALTVIRHSQADYTAHFGDPAAQLAGVLERLVRRVRGT